MLFMEHDHWPKQCLLLYYMTVSNFFNLNTLKWVGQSETLFSVAILKLCLLIRKFREVILQYNFIERHLITKTY